MSRSLTGLLLALVVATSAGLTVAAARHNSTTFDEIIPMAGGARGWRLGDWEIQPEHPPLMNYVYGLPIYLSGPSWPPEPAPVPEMGEALGFRYAYGRWLFWTSGNDPERLAFLGRLPATLFAMALTLLAFAFVRRHYGPGAGLLAALLVAFTPDVLAHGGVAYNDILLAPLYLGGVWALDAAARRPSWRTGLLAGVVCGLALGTKNSAVALAPVALLLLGAEAWVRRADAAWRRRVAGAAGAGLVALYLTLVLLYRGDPLLEEYRYAVGFVLGQVSEGAPSYLLGEASRDGFRTFFPVAFLFKTSAAFHLLLLLAAAALLPTAWRRPERLLRSPLRAPLAGLAVFGALLLSSSLNLGFRYALPTLPLLAVLVAVGAHRLWTGARTRTVPVVIALATAWLVVHPLTAYPWFLGYLSEYGPPPERAHHVLVDSSLDWGQGLLELRDFMEEEGIERVSLSYFGSALPGGYGIDYVPLPSYFPLPSRPVPPAVPEPEWVVVSATSLTGIYLEGDPFRALRARRPDAVLARSFHVFHLRDGP